MYTPGAGSRTYNTEKGSKISNRKRVAEYGTQKNQENI